MFNEGITLEQKVLDTLCGSMTSSMVAKKLVSYRGEIRDWRFVAAEALPRQHFGIFVESMVIDALIRLNSVIKGKPDRADKVFRSRRRMRSHRLPS